MKFSLLLIYSSLGNLVLMCNLLLCYLFLNKTIVYILTIILHNKINVYSTRISLYQRIYNTKSVSPNQ